MLWAEEQARPGEIVDMVQAAFPSESLPACNVTLILKTSALLISSHLKQTIQALKWTTGKSLKSLAWTAPKAF